MQKMNQVSYLMSSAMLDLHSLPKGSRPESAVRNNGPEHLVLERYKLRELAEGWPMYRYRFFEAPLVAVIGRNLPSIGMPANGKTSKAFLIRPHMSTRPGPAKRSIRILSKLQKGAWTLVHL